MPEVLSVSTKPENWEKLKNAEYRRALAIAQFKRFVPFQISALRRQRNWSQELLAERSGLTQGVISRAEDTDYGNLTVNTILRIANGLDLVFLGKFVSYSEFEYWRKQLSESAVVPGFEAEDAEFEKAFLASATLFGSHQNQSSLGDGSAQSGKQADNVVSIEKFSKAQGQKTCSNFAAAAGGGQQ